MAKIYLKRRKLPIEVSNDRAIIVKNKKYGLNGETPKQPTDWIDLVEWIGEYGEIASVELDPVQSKEKDVDYSAELRKQEEDFMKMSPETKSKQFGWFKLAWYCKSGLTEMSPPPEVLKKAEELAFKWYSENPEARRMNRDIYKPLLVARFGLGKVAPLSQTLGEKMSVPKVPDTEEIF